MSRKHETRRLLETAREHDMAQQREEAAVVVPAAPPNIIDFVTGEQWLNRPNLYPRQATLLKIFFLQDHLFTQYDLQVIDQWARDFTRSGDHGIVPDVLRRIEINKAKGRKWFREIDLVIGRRGGKGYLGALAGAYVLYHYLSAGGGDPQAFYGIDRDKRLKALVFGTKHGQAKADLWRDLVDVIIGAPCFEPWIANAGAESLMVQAPHDLVRTRALADRGIKSGTDPSTFEIVPKESTASAGRGSTSFMQFYDEMAHVDNAGGRPAEDVYQSATPALDQFGVDAFIFASSSPWQKTGQFYENCQRALEVDETGEPSYPEMLVVQLTSWDPYENWQFTKPTKKRPRGMPMRAPLSTDQTALNFDPHVVADETIATVPHFQPLQRAIQDYDDQLRNIERANPERFNVERRSHWAATADAYLNEARVDEIFAPYQGRRLEMQTGGPLSTSYRMHGDPSKSGANFGLSIAHVDVDEAGWQHVVFDLIHVWRPQDFPENRNEIDYRQIEDELKDWMDAFKPDTISFDQFNSVHTIQELRDHARHRQYPGKHVTVYERTANRALNWETAETFKTAIGLGLVHAPHFELVELELKFLQDLGGKVDHPTSGPVQTKDVADTMMILVHDLIGDQMNHFVAGDLATLPLRLSQPHTPAAPVPTRPDPIEGLRDVGHSRQPRSWGRERPPPDARGRGYGQPRPPGRVPRRWRSLG